MNSESSLPNTKPQTRPTCTCVRTVILDCGSICFDTMAKIQLDAKPLSPKDLCSDRISSNNIGIKLSLATNWYQCNSDTLDWLAGLNTRK